MRRLPAAMAAILLPAAMLASLLPACAYAQEEAPKGMPQLDFANPLTISQIVWLAIIFAVLYLLLSRWALPQVGSVLTERAARIAADLDGARAAKAEADLALQEARDSARRSQADAQAQINAAVDQAKQTGAEQAARLGAQIDARIAQSEATIAAARTSAMAGLRAIATDVASDMVERLSGRPPAATAADAAVGRLLGQSDLPHPA